MAALGGIVLITDVVTSVAPSVQEATEPVKGFFYQVRKSVEICLLCCIVFGNFLGPQKGCR